MMDLDTDTRLYIEYGKTGNPKLFREIWEKFKGPVLSTIMRITLLQKFQAEDLLSEVFMKVIEERSRFTPKAKFSTWLYRVTLNRSYNALRDRKHFVSVDESIPEEREDTVLERMEARETANALRTAMAKLSERQRAALTLREFQDKSYQEIAEIMNTSVDAVESLLFHSRKQLKMLLSGRTL